MTELERLEIEYVPLTDIAPNRYNPNRMPAEEFELLKRSIDEDGMTQPIIVVENPDEDGKPYRIVDGEHRWLACDEVGLDEIPVVCVPLDEAEARVATLRHNKARGSHDLELEADVLRDLRELGALEWAQDRLGMEDVELDRLMSDETAPELWADEEYSDAWEPVPMDAETKSENESGTSTTSMTPAALKEREKKEEEARRAETEEEAEEIRSQVDTYRLVCIYDGDQAELVKEVLGDEPAATVHKLCRRALDR